MEHTISDRDRRHTDVSSPSTTNWDALFVADPAHIHWFGNHVLKALGSIAPTRVLDIGCGDGSLLLYLAHALPAAFLMGVDLSAHNIAAAREVLARSPDRDRIEVVHGDYLQLDAGRFDLVVASSSLQGIQATSEQLAAKIARDTAAGGRVIHVTPYRCLYNTALNSVRRALRLMRGSTTDQMILIAAQLLHPGQSRDKLRQRVDYMYLVLRHHEDGLRVALGRHGFRLVATALAPHTSAGQPRHRLAVLAAPTAGSGV